MEPKLDQNPPKSSPDGGPKWGTPSDRGAKKSKENTNATKKRVALHSPPPLVRKSGQYGPNLGPKLEPKWTKIDAKIDQKFDVSWDRFLVGFWRILEGKIEPSWHQNRSKIDANCEMQFFEKSCSGCSLGSIFVILGVEVESKSRLEID